MFKRVGLTLMVAFGLTFVWYWLSCCADGMVSFVAFAWLCLIANSVVLAGSSVLVVVLFWLWYYCVECCFTGVLVLRLVGGVCRGRLLFTLFVLWLFVWFIMICVCVWFDGDLRWVC